MPVQLQAIIHSRGLDKTLDGATGMENLVGSCLAAGTGPAAVPV